ELPKQNILISGNSFNIQNRNPDGGSYGIVTGPGATTNLTITNNTISFDPSGLEFTTFYGIAVNHLNNATITNNTIGFTVLGLYNFATGSGVTLLNNR